MSSSAVSRHHEYSWHVTLEKVLLLARSVEVGRRNGVQLSAEQWSGCGRRALFLVRIDRSA